MSIQNISPLLPNIYPTDIMVLLLDETGQKIKSRTKYQHMAYVLQEQGVNLKLHFESNLFGPWSENLANYLYALIGTGDIKEETVSIGGTCMNTHVYTITRSGRRRAEYVRRMLHNNPETLEKIKSVAKEWKEYNKEDSMTKLGQWRQPK